MPHVGTDWDDTDPEEDQPYPIDFSPDLTTGETIVFPGPTASIEVVEGEDNAAAACLHGGVQLEGNVAAIWARGLAAGVKYRILIEVPTSAGKTLQRWAHVRSQVRTLA